MGLLPRLGVTFKVGLLALAAGAAIAACGSITVISPDGGDGPGTGGAGHGSVGGKGGGGTSDGGALGGSNGGGSGGTSGGQGGRGGGSGGTSGLGGRTGSGGVSGLGGNSGVGGGAGTQTCAEIRASFKSALAEAKVCTNNSQCSLFTNDQIECGCPTSVTATDKVESYRRAWTQNGCGSGVCPAILCTFVSGGTCTAVPGASSTCVDQSLGMP